MTQPTGIQRNNGGRLSSRGENALERLRQDFDNLFGSFWGSRMSPFDQELGSLRVWDFGVTENDKEIVVRAELPGFEENELDVQISNDTLTIKAEKEQKGEGREEFRSFYRTLTLPAGVRSDDAQATYRNGVLELHLPRAEEAKPRRVMIQGAQGQKTPPSQSGSQEGNPGLQAGATSPARAKQ